MGRPSFRTAALALAQRDPVFAQLVEDTGLPSIPAPTETHFATLVRSVVYQQLATPAAAAIHRRLLAALDDDVSAERITATPPEVLRASGLSGRKVESLRELAARTVDGTIVLEPRRLARIGDEEIIDRLSQVKGIGRWSAQMFLIFQLRRLDVWPVGDLGVRKGYAMAWRIDVPTPKQLEVLGEPYRPYRSVVAWYCWRAVEIGAGRSVAPIET